LHSIVGEDQQGRQKVKPGDIVVQIGRLHDIHHVGIVQKKGKSIRATAKKLDGYKVIINDWGFRGTKEHIVRFFRYLSKQLTSSEL